MVWIRVVIVNLDKCEWFQESEGKIAKTQEFVGEEKDYFISWNVIDSKANCLLRCDILFLLPTNSWKPCQHDARVYFILYFSGRRKIHTFYPHMLSNYNLQDLKRGTEVYHYFILMGIIMWFTQRPFLLTLISKVILRRKLSTSTSDIVSV